MFSKTKAVKIEPPLTSTNPFSPVKNKGNRVLPVEQTYPPPNQFSTPRKEVEGRELSPDPFPLIQPVASPSQATLSSQPASAVSRARKRLRGEPVSPSPVKPKRPRGIPSDGPIPFLARRPFDSDEDHDHDSSDDNEPCRKPGPAVFEETPRKDRSGNKFFTSLFNEDDRFIQPNFSPAVTQPQSASRKAEGSGLLIRTPNQTAGLSLSDNGDDDESVRVLPRVQTQTQLRTRQKPKPSDARADTRGKALNISSRLASSKGINLLDQGPRTLRSMSVSVSSSTKSNPSSAPSTPDHNVSKLPPTSSAPTSDADIDENSDYNDDGKNKVNLVPVSPPPPSLISTTGYGNANVRRKGKGNFDFTSGAGKWKGKGKTSAQTPTWKLGDDDSHDEGLDDEGDLPAVRVYQGRNTTSQVSREGELLVNILLQEEEITKDLVSGIKRRIASPDPDLPFTPSQIQPQDGDMVVNLRDEFRTILDLKTNAAPLEIAASGIGVGGKGEYARYARVARAVRDGTRVIGMFDPSRGGHIWGVGETEREADADLGTEDFQFGLEHDGGGDEHDDWEGEGVPWEVAELEHDDDETRL